VVTSLIVTCMITFGREADTLQAYYTLPRRFIPQYICPSFAHHLGSKARFEIDPGHLLICLA
jgi:hypothetical protein